MSARLQAPLGALTLDNPFINASGTYGYAVEYADFVDVARLGGVSVKGISLEPRPGNAPPRTAETAAGMLNSIGLANIGIEAFVRDTMPRLRELGVTVIANTFATSIEDFVELARALTRSKASPPWSSIFPAPMCTPVACTSVSPARRPGRSPPRCAR